MDEEKPKPLQSPSQLQAIPADHFRALDGTRLYKGMKLETRTASVEKPKLIQESVATAAQTVMRGPEGMSVQPKKKIELINFIQDPLTDSDKGKLEAAARRNEYVRIALRIREQAAFKKQKLVVDLTDEAKEDMTEEEISKKVKSLKDNKKIQNLLFKFRTRDKNVGIKEKLKTLGVQCWIFGRNLIIVTFKEDSGNEVKDLITINSRRLGDPILNTEDDMSFEGCMVDSEPLIKDSMIYATYNEREISPHTAHFGYPPLETVMHIAETHNIITEEDTKEIAKSGWLPTILIPVNTEDLGESQKGTRIQNIINNINPAKVLGYSAEHITEPLQTVDMQPKSNWLETMTDSLEMKILNAFHVPLFLGKTDKIANRDTANKSAQLFIDGIVADDQEWMEELLLKQWYEPLLREELKKDNSLMQDSEDSSAADETVDTETPEADDAPLPFVIKRKFEKMQVEQLLDMAQTLVSLVEKNIWDIQKANEILDTEEVTPRVIKEKEENEKKMEEQMKMKMDTKPKPSAPMETATAARSDLLGKALQIVNQKLSLMRKPSSPDPVVLDNLRGESIAKKEMYENTTKLLKKKMEKLEQ